MYFNKIILFVSLHLTISLKSNDFCIPIQKVCRGYYDINQTYQIKCNLIDCYGSYSIKCSNLNICSNIKSNCNEYINKLSNYEKIINLIIFKIPKYAKILKERYNKNKNKNKNLKNCQFKPYNFKKNDFCLNGLNCFEIKKELKGFGFNYRSFITKLKIDCRCPKRQSFRCGNYCSIDSIACDHYKSMNEFNFVNFKYCVNYNITSYTYMNFSLIKKNF